MIGSFHDSRKFQKSSCMMIWQALEVSTTAKLWFLYENFFCLPCPRKRYSLLWWAIRVKIPAQLWTGNCPGPLENNILISAQDVPNRSVGKEKILKISLYINQGSLWWFSNQQFSKVPSGPLEETSSIPSCTFLATQIPNLASLAPNADMVLVGLKYLISTLEPEISLQMHWGNRGQGGKPYL